MNIKKELCKWNMAGGFARPSLSLGAFIVCFKKLTYMYGYIYEIDLHMYGYI